MSRAEWDPRVMKAFESLPGFERYREAPSELAVSIVSMQASHVVEHRARRLDRMLAQISSPIEQAMFAALVWYGSHWTSSIFRVGDEWLASDVETQDAEKKWLASADYGDLDLLVEWQVPVGTYKADFMLTYRSWVFPGPTTDTARKDSVRLVVECDGHDYHERTKEQALHDRKRDREMQKAGLRVFRYPGSAIWADALACAREAIKGANDMHYEHAKLVDGMP